MKTVRLVLGILSIVLAFFMLLTSCAGAFTSGLTSDENLGTSSGLGMFIAFIVLASGISAICTRKSKIGSIITGIIYLIGYIAALSDTYNQIGGTFGSITLILAIIFILSGIIQFFIKPKTN